MIKQSLKAFALLIIALLVVFAGTQPVQAANQEFTMALDGGKYPLSGQITLSNLTSSSLATIDGNGKAKFKLFPGAYKISLGLGGVYQGLQVGGQVTVPGSVQIKLPEPTISTVEYKLPSGVVLPNVYDFFGSSIKRQVTFESGGFTWTALLINPVENVNGKISYALFSSNQPQNPINLTFALPDSSGGLPTGKPSLAFETLASGGVIQLEDGAFPDLQVSEISGASGSTFTIPGSYHFEGSGQASIFSIWVTENTFFNVRGPQEKTYLNSKSRPLKLGSANLNEGKFKITLPLTANGRYLYAYNPIAFGYPSKLVPIRVRMPKSKYKNCAELNLDFQGGVSNSKSSTSIGARFEPTLNSSLYKVVKGLDRDKDGVACEK